MKDKMKMSKSAERPQEMAAAFPSMRERLVEQLVHAEENLVVLSAGMGYGKTVLLEQAMPRLNRPCIYCQMGGTTGSAADFFEVIRRKASALPVSVPALEEKTALSPEGYGMRLAEAFSLLEERVTIVLEDYHLAAGEEMNRLLPVLLKRAPRLQVILSTRSAPPPFFARLLLERRALVVGEEALAFTDEETASLIAPFVLPESRDELVQAVQDYTLGWPAAVSLLLLHYDRRGTGMTVENLRQAFHHSYLRDYFMHELFDSLPLETRQFLKAVSVLEHPDAQLAAAVTGNPCAAAVLLSLAENHLFLQVDETGGSFSCHPLFRLFLQSLLSLGERQVLFQRAAAACGQNGRQQEAVTYALAGGDGEQIQEMVETAGWELVQNLQWTQLEGWLSQLARTDTPPSVRILLLRALTARWYGRLEEATRLAEQVLSLSEGKTEELAAAARLLLAGLADTGGRKDEALAILNQLDEALTGRSDLPPLLYRLTVEARLFVRLDLGQAEQALADLRKGLEESTLRQDRNRQSWYRRMAIFSYTMAGDYRQAMQLYLVLRSRGGSCSMSSLSMGIYLLVSGRISQGEERLAAARQALQGDARPQLRQLVTLFQLIAGRLSHLEQLPWQETGEDLPLPAGPAPVFWLLQGLLRSDSPDPHQVEMLFQLNTAELLPAQDAVRWLLVRKLVLDGERERALVLCQRAEEAAGASRVSAFLAFLAVEQALLMRESDPARALTLMGRWNAYLLEHRLICPCLTTEEQQALQQLMSCCEEETLLDEQDGGQPAGTARVRVCCFGRLRVLLPDGQELRWRTRKAQELFAYLFHLNGTSVDRETLLDQLWPQCTTANTASLLHTSLYSIRKNLAPYGLGQLIQRDRQGYRMDVSLVESDREKMEALCKGDPEEGAALASLYQGPYLEDIEAIWAEDSRAWYAGLFLRSIRPIAKRRMEAGDYRRAVACLRAAIRQEPYDEGLAAMLIRCYASLGEVKNAMTLYNRLKDTLMEDLGTEPGEELRQVYKECLLKRLGSRRSME